MVLADDSGQAIAPLAAAVAGLADLPSCLTLAWLAIVLPTTCEPDRLLLFGEMDLLKSTEQLRK